jgi:AcrR family transcriptional regulator
MTSEVEPSRKEALLEQIIEYLRDKSISALSFRTLATALDVSTFTLVYHFGTRTELVNEIVASITDTQVAEVRNDIQPQTLDSYLTQIHESFDWIVLHQYRHLQRLELESSIANVLDPEAIEFTRSVYTGWLESSAVVLRSLGLDEADADIHARSLLNSFYGSQYDIVINDDEASTRAAFAVAVDAHGRQIRQLIAATNATTAVHSATAEKPDSETGASSIKN